MFPYNIPASFNIVGLDTNVSSLSELLQLKQQLEERLAETVHTETDGLTVEYIKQGDSITLPLGGQKFVSATFSFTNTTVTNGFITFNNVTFTSGSKYQVNLSSSKIAVYIYQAVDEKAVKPEPVVNSSEKTTFPSAITALTDPIDDYNNIEFSLTLPEGVSVSETDFHINSYSNNDTTYRFQLGSNNVFPAGPLNLVDYIDASITFQYGSDVAEQATSVRVYMNYGSSGAIIDVNGDTKTAEIVNAGFGITSSEPVKLKVFSSYTSNYHLYEVDESGNATEINGEDISGDYESGDYIITIKPSKGVLRTLQLSNLKKIFIMGV